MTADVRVEPFLAAVREAWDKAQGTVLAPAGYELTHVIADGDSLIVQVADSSGSRFATRVELPAVAGWEGKTQGTEGTPEHWALWNVLVPLIEELETNAVSRFPIDAGGVRWIEA